MKAKAICRGFQMDARALKLLKYGTLYAQDLPVEAPVGVPADFIDISYLDNNSYWPHDSSETMVERIVKDNDPLPAEVNREGYCPGHHLAFWLSGYADYRNTIDLLKPLNVTYGRCLDFGGSTGRVFRHFIHQSDNWDVWSCDFKLSSVEWVLRHMSRKVKVFNNTSMPVLPLPDDYFDLVMAFSVFTHLNEPELNWLVELRRILRPGGVAYITIHDENTWQNMSASLRSTVERWRPDIVDLKEMPSGKTVVTFREDDPYNCNVFHSQEYIARVWGRFFKTRETRPLWVGKQAVVVCQKPFS